MLRTPRRHADHRQGESETRQAPYAAEAPAAPVRTPMRRPRIMPSSERIENTCLGSARRAVRCTAIGATNCRRARRSCAWPRAERAPTRTNALADPQDALVDPGPKAAFSRFRIPRTRWWIPAQKRAKHAKWIPGKRKKWILTKVDPQSALADHKRTQPEVDPRSALADPQDALADLH